MGNPAGDIVGQADKKFAVEILKNVNLVRCRHSAIKLVAGARFELATFRL
jgi:hypothetical protein